METVEVLEEIKLMSDNNERIARVKRFISEDEKFKVPFYGESLVSIPECLLFLLEYQGTIDHFTEFDYYKQKGRALVNQETYNYFSLEVKKLREGNLI